MRFAAILWALLCVSASADVLEKARFLRANGMVAEAKKELTFLIFHEDTPADTKAEALLLLGEIALAEKNFSGARENWQKVVATYPNTRSATTAQAKLDVLVQLAPETPRREKARDEPTFETIRFPSTVWDSRAEPVFRDAEGNEYVSTRGCRGELEITATHLRFHDPTFCWKRPDLDVHYKAIEWISYERWSQDTEVTIKLESKDWTAKFSMPGTVPLKLLRHLTEVSPTTRQHCGEMALNRNQAGTFDAVRTPVFCSQWLAN